MKFLAIIFSIFIVYLVSVPCVDEIIHVEKSTLEKSTSQGQPCNHGDHDACTPFCICSCCGVVVVLANIHFNSKPIYSIETEILSIYKETTSSFSQSFWQPPKLV